MLAGTNVSAVKSTATGDVTTARARLHSVYFVSSAVAGSLVFKTGGSGGTTLLEITTPAAVGMDSVEVPLDGILFPSGIHVTVSNVTALTTMFSY